MIPAQVGLGFSPDTATLVMIWAGMCGAVLATAAVSCDLIVPLRRGFPIGLGIGAALMSLLTLTLWLWFDPALLLARWMIAVPLVSLVAGLWALFMGLQHYAREP